MDKKIFEVNLIYNVDLRRKVNQVIKFLITRSRVYEIFLQELKEDLLNINLTCFLGSQNKIS